MTEDYEDYESIDQDHINEKLIKDAEFRTFLYENYHNFDTDEFDIEIHCHWKIHFLTCNDLIIETINTYPKMIKYVPFPSLEMKLLAVSHDPLVDIEIDPAEDHSILDYLRDWLFTRELTDDIHTELRVANILQNAYKRPIKCKDSALEKLLNLQ